MATLALQPRRCAPWLASLALSLLSAGAVEAGRGVVVEEVTPGFGGQMSGLAAGDVLRSWSRPPTSPRDKRRRGAIESAFDLLDVEIEQGPRGPVTLVGRRGRTEMQWTLPMDEWRVGARPHFVPDLAALHEDARRVVAEKPLEAAALWEQAAGRVKPSERALSAWLLLRAAGAAGRVRDWKRTDELHARAVASLDDRRLRREAVSALTSWAETFVRRAAWTEARDRYERARHLQESVEADGLVGARLLRLIGDTFLDEDASAEAHYRRALATRERLAPDSGAVADSLNALGRLASRQGDTAAAVEYARRAVLIRETVTPGGQKVALDVTALARALASTGDYGGAERHVARALAILEPLAPKSTEMGYALSIAGQVALLTGDLATSERHHRRALDNFQALAPSGLNVAAALRSLSTVAWTRRDFESAESRARESLAILERLAPGTSSLNELVHALGDIALDSGDVARAEEHFRRALSQDEARSRDSAAVANDLRCLSLAQVRAGRAEEAEPHAVRSVEIRRRLAPGSLDLAQSLVARGEIARTRGRLDVAEASYREAIEIAARFGSANRQEVEARYGLGRVFRQGGRPAEAAEAFLQAIDAVERQRRRLGGTDEARTNFAAAYAGGYQQAMEVLVELRRFEDAFHVLERSRARSLLDFIDERRLLFSADLPPDLARARQLHQTTYDRAQSELEALDPAKDTAAIERQVARLRDLREQSVEITARLRAASPRLAAVEHPAPCDLPAARAALDAGDAFVAYAVGPEKTLVFAVEPASSSGDGLTVATIPFGEKALRDDVEAFRTRLTSPYAHDPELQGMAARLYDRLLRPVERVLAASRSVAISPDGPLHLLPFAALVHVEGSEKKAEPRWFAEWRPIHRVASASHYAELRKSRRPSAPREARLVAFGDPAYPAVAPSSGASLADASTRGMRSTAAQLGALPYSRVEVESIAALFEDRAVTYLGGEATEEQAKQRLSSYTYVHFACHGLLDEQVPMHSALVLSLPEGPDSESENGLLQVWEILDGVRLDADLVTLSACKTGLGREMRGEGLQGLTRAFQYAGARSVLASLWSASDRATADLMVRVYTSLRQGVPKAEALRQAQRELIRRGAPPFHWAAFEMFGDGR